ncbi:hypothetical protein Q5P01_010547 [Channa striata]|uniref:Uncharacterized protein n=1 Tax=Channa striata TaxID=64152 RepID=A0AA88N1R4_CHASR|nr:hypothetical protein Q5P01_010547 [Channa striata]
MLGEQRKLVTVGMVRMAKAYVNGSIPKANHARFLRLSRVGRHMFLRVKTTVMRDERVRAERVLFMALCRTDYSVMPVGLGIKRLTGAYKLARSTPDMEPGCSRSCSEFTTKFPGMDFGKLTMNKTKLKIALLDQLCLHSKFDASLGLQALSSRCCKEAIVQISGSPLGHGGLVPGRDDERGSATSPSGGSAGVHRERAFFGLIKRPGTLRGPEHARLIVRRTESEGGDRSVRSVGTRCRLIAEGYQMTSAGTLVLNSCGRPSSTPVPSRKCSSAEALGGSLVFSGWQSSIQ